jgi:hypothetical protein
MKIKELLQQLEGYDPESEILVIFTGMDTITTEHKTECHLYDEHRKLDGIQSGMYSPILQEYYSRFALNRFQEKQIPLPADIVPAILIANQNKI